MILICVKRVTYRVDMGSAMLVQRSDFLTHRRKTHLLDTGLAIITQTLKKNSLAGHRFSYNHSNTEEKLTCWTQVQP
jgi:hypothetical protein